MAEFCVRCSACNHWNIPNLKNDILKMISKTGLVCSKCSKPINPRDTGQWVHQEESRKFSFAGYHVPQIVMPMHYELSHKWAIIWEKYNNSRLSQTVFYNECLGESSDLGTKLLTVTDVKKISIESIKNDPKITAVESFLRNYSQISMGVDWGGQTAPIGRGRMAHMGEDSSEAVSFTTVAVVGQRPDGKQQCIFAYRFPLTADHVQEANYIMELFNLFKCALFAHDFGGSGAARETIMIQAGMNPDRIVPLLYVGHTTKNFITFNGADETRARNYWSLDKSRSLMTMCLAIKGETIFLPEYSSSKDVTHDLLALMEDKVERPGASDILRIVRQPKQRDDFAHSLNYAVTANWHSTGSWPRFALASGYGAQQPWDNPDDATY